MLDMAHHSQNQPRHRPGTPVGGRWTDMVRPHADIALTDEPTLGDDPFAYDTDDSFQEGPQPVEYDISAANIDVAKRKIDAANRRLAKAGITERFEMTVEPYSKTQKEPNTGRLIKLDRAKVILNRPRIAYDGYTFAARIDTTESGRLIAMSAPGVELDGWQPTSMTCDHCGTNRSRKNVYVVRDEAGEYKVIGSSCLENYTGVHPQGLWVLQWDDLAELQSEDDLSPGGGGWSHGHVAAPTDDVLAVAAATAQVQGSYQSRYSDRPTTGLTSEVLFATADTKEQRDLHGAIRRAADQVDVEELKADIREALAGEDSDWARNVLMLMDEDAVGDRHARLLASAISAVERLRAKKRERATIAEGHLAPVGEKVENVPARVLALREFSSYYGVRARTTTLVKMQAASGHIVTWWASNPPKLDEGDEVVIDRATVKKHDEYDGQDQTVVTRAKLTLATR